MVKVGRYTAALLLLSVGGLLIWDQATGSVSIRLLLQWWPVLFILWGLEFIVLSFLYRDGKKFRLDFAGVFVAVLISGIVFGVSQPSYLKELWHNIDLSDVGNYSEQSGARIDKDTEFVQLDPGTQRLVVNNPNGSVVLRKGPAVDRIAVDTVIWIDTVSEQEARHIAEQSELKVNPGQTVSLTANGQTYGASGKRKPKMNFVITLPEHRELDVELKLVNGDIEAEDIPIRDELKISTNNGQVKVANAGGDIVANTLNGAIEIRDADGNVRAETKNGNITVEGVERSVDLETLNGDIEVRAVHVGGDWNLYTAIGDILVALPEEGDYTVDGSNTFGSIASELPLDINENMIYGMVGAGTYSIRLETIKDIQVKKN